MRNLQFGSQNQRALFLTLHLGWCTQAAWANLNTYLAQMSHWQHSSQLETILCTWLGQVIFYRINFYVYWRLSQFPSHLILSSMVSFLNYQLVNVMSWYVKIVAQISSWMCCKWCIRSRLDTVLIYSYENIQKLIFISWCILRIDPGSLHALPVVALTSLATIVNSSTTNQATQLLRPEAQQLNTKEILLCSTLQREL